MTKELDIDVSLEGSQYTKIDSINFVDSNKQPGVALGGKFSNLDEIKTECYDYDIYIYSLQEMRSEKGLLGYWMIYGCREKTVGGSTKLAMWRK